MFKNIRNLEKRIDILEERLNDRTNRIDSLNSMLIEYYKNSCDLESRIRLLCNHPRENVRYELVEKLFGKNGTCREYEFVCGICGKWLDRNKYKFEEAKIIEIEVKDVQKEMQNKKAKN